MADKKKLSFTRCPHCTQRYGSETSLAAHVNDHRAEYMQKAVHPDHQAVLHPKTHHDELRKILKRGGHG